ncbi:cobalt transporter CbiM [Celerinatantimonas sp. YJH-8]|uniref:cobalt transporter CbiM n=1 Tax=Celerinatantimonas sp. YJH-8 TaxID=3228714 RepID=UPI0038CA2C1F
MAHIPEGVLSTPVLVTGAVVTVVAMIYAIKRMDYDRLPQTAVLAATFFVASLVAFPVGPSSEHLLLNGLMGLILGWMAVPALLVALALQALFFGFGGPFVLGVNTLDMALPAIICYYGIGPLLRRAIVSGAGKKIFFLIGGLAGLVGVFLTGVMVCVVLVLSGPEYYSAGKVILITYIPLMLIEAVVTAIVIQFIAQVSPELLLDGRQRIETKVSTDATH